MTNRNIDDVIYQIDLKFQIICFLPILSPQGFRTFFYYHYF